MRLRAITLLAAAVASLLSIETLSASGLVGIYGIVERVVFEPTPGAPERVQVWGAFVYVDRAFDTEVGVSDAKRGYLYFTLPRYPQRTNELEIVRREWADLQAVAGTGQAVGFGGWGYIGAFSGLQPDTPATGRPAYILERVPQGGTTTDLRVRPASEPPSGPASYQTNVGVVKLGTQGRHGEITKALREALGR
jgi:hypothetical protein